MPDKNPFIIFLTHLKPNSVFLFPLDVEREVGSAQFMFSQQVFITFFPYN